MALPLSELLCHLTKQERSRFLRLDPAGQAELRAYILESVRLPRSAADLEYAPGTVSGPAVGRTREVERGFVELR